MTSLELSIAPGLAVRFEDLPSGLCSVIGAYLHHFDSRSSERAEVLEITADRVRPELSSPSRVILEEEGLIVREAEGVTTFEMGSIAGWCDRTLGRGGFHAADASEEEVQRFVGLALAPLLIELAEGRGWLGLHAAAVAFEGSGVLLPGRSGVGKSTVFRRCHRAGLDVLSDDLVWLKEGEDGAFRIFPFPRGVAVAKDEEPMPPPSIPSVRARAIVCPEIVDRESSRLREVGSTVALEVLLAQSGFLGAKATAGGRFRTLVRLANSVPCHRLEAGRNSREIPHLLRRHAAALARSDS